MSFSEDLAAAKNIERPHKDVDVVLNGHLHTLRFTQSAPDEWALAMDLNPPRLGVAVDNFGFNLRGAVRYLAPRVGALLVEGVPTPLRVDPFDKDNPKDPNRVDEWSDLLGALSGHFYQKIGDAIFELNIYGPSEAVKDAKKKLKRSALISSLQPDTE